jgi:hypothetical protein
MSVEQTQSKGQTPSVGSGSLVRAIEVSGKLITTRDTMKRILGPEKWAKNVAEIRPQIEALMKRRRLDNVLAAVLPVAQEMSAAGQAPAMLLAVACEMIAPSEPTQ